MKKTIYTLGIISALAFVGCGEKESKEASDEKKPTAEKQEPQESTLTVDTEKSRVDWHLGKKKNADDFHEGFLKLSSGTIVMKDGKIVSGSFDVDMNTIAETAPKEDSAMFTQHMKGERWFNTETYPVSTFQIKSINGDTITGDLTVMGMPMTISFPVRFHELSNDRLVADATFGVNRLEFGLKNMSDEDETPEEKQLDRDIQYVVHIEAAK